MLLNQMKTRPGNPSGKESRREENIGPSTSRRGSKSVLQTIIMLFYDGHMLMMQCWWAWIEQMGGEMVLASWQVGKALNWFWRQWLFYDGWLHDIADDEDKVRVWWTFIKRREDGIWRSTSRQGSRLKALLVISSSFYCETTIMGMAIMKIKKRLDHLLQICSHEILGVGELGGQS